MHKKINIEKTSMYQFSLLNYHIKVLILDFLKSFRLIKDNKKPAKPKKYKLFYQGKMWEENE